MAPESSAVKRGSGGTSQPDDGLKYEVKGSFTKECNSPSQLDSLQDLKVVAAMLHENWILVTSRASLYNCS